MTADAPGLRGTMAEERSGAPVRRRRLRPRRVLTYAFIITISAIWLFPLVWVLLVALRPLSLTTAKGYFNFSILNLDNFSSAWDQANIGSAYISTLIVTVPAVIITLLVGSMVAFAVSRFSWRFNLLVLLLFTAGNLLPQQVLILPIYKLFTWDYLKFFPWPFSDAARGMLFAINFVLANNPISLGLTKFNGGLYDQYAGVILVHIVFQTGFCVFVLSNYMKTLSKEITEAALVDGAGVFRIWAAITMPLCKPAVAAMATLEFTFIYNDFFWALFLMSTGTKRPITAALQNLQGQFSTNFNQLAAGALLAAVPTILVFLVLQRYFVSGLTLGSTKG